MGLQCILELGLSRNELDLIGLSIIDSWGSIMARDSQTYRPKARSAGLDIEDLSDEIVVYDRTSDQVHLLSASVAKIWRLCDGKREIVDIVDALEGDDVSMIAVDGALSELEAFELLDMSEQPPASQPPVNLTRRSMLTHAAGASAFAGATIVTLQAPLARSLLTKICQSASDCQEDCSTAVGLNPHCGQCINTTVDNFTCTGSAPKTCGTTGGPNQVDVFSCGCNP